MQFFSIYLLC